MPSRSDSPNKARSTRRAVLASTGLIGASSLAGCLGLFGRPGGNPREAAQARPESTPRNSAGTPAGTSVAPDVDSPSQGELVREQVTATDEESTATPESPSSTTAIYQDGPVDSPDQHENLDAESGLTASQRTRLSALPEPADGRSIEAVSLEVLQVEYDPTGEAEADQLGQLDVTDSGFTFAGSAFSEFGCDEFELDLVFVMWTQGNVMIRIKDKSTDGCTGSDGPDNHWRHDLRVQGRFGEIPPDTLRVRVRNRDGAPFVEEAL